MDKKAKLIIIGLAVFTLIFLFLLIQTSGDKENLMRLNEEMKRRNSALELKAENDSANLRSLENKVNEFSREIDRVSQDKIELQRKYDLLSRAKDDLVEKLKAAKSQPQEEQRAQVVQQQFVARSSDDVYWAGILKAKTDLELQLINLRSELKGIKLDNDQLMKEKASLEIDLSGLKREKEDMSQQMAYNQKVMDSIAQELVREKNDKAQIVENLKAIKGENAFLSRQLKNLNNRKFDLEKKLQQTQEEKDALARRMDEMEAMLSDKLNYVDKIRDQLSSARQVKEKASDLETKDDSQDQSVKLPAIVVRPQSTTSGSRDSLGQGGKVVAINRDSNFLIIDLGDNAGVKQGDNFHVYRGNQSIALLQVIQVRSNISACDIKKENSPVKIGDLVR
jgi:myosin heavy subunit